MWTHDLQARIEQLSRWGESQNLPRTFWLGGLTFPTGFLTAVKQQSLQTLSKSHPGISIDRVGWEFSVTDALTEVELSKPAPEGSVYIRGLYLEGAGWDIQKNTLIEPEPMQLTCLMPIITFIPAVLADKKKGSSSTAPAPSSTSAPAPSSSTPKIPQYMCPCYYYPIRTGERERPSYMLEVSLNTSTASSDHWMKRGTALLMNLSS